MNKTPIKPGAYYMVRANCCGFSYWSNPHRGDQCSSANVKRTTLEEVGEFLASLHVGDMSRVKSIDVFEVPEQPTLTIPGPVKR